MAKKSLLQDLENPVVSKKRGVACGVHRILESLDNDEKASVQQRIDQLREERSQIAFGGGVSFTAKWLSDVLTANGHPVSHNVINIHIRKSCACGY